MPLAATLEPEKVEDVFDLDVREFGGEADTEMRAFTDCTCVPISCCTCITCPNC
ncbi:hypothetical protein ACFOSC_10975 [Streptantibioticus rubrisoli]|uniref:Uncharacterized protein n=1 Tax=Streptantibioticus rubrisoli TaxID=1387313 RepID=A0ABT1PL04_9ACTN|nr:hypothetical protein [Streptantibioticus rubrisoli]MCQ4045228.1 hypothetical protein [Streptantibioticus rubrisoli]